MEPAIYNFKVQRNGDYPLYLQFLQGDGVTPVDLTSYTVLMKLYSLGKIAELYTPSITYTSRVNGEVTAYLPKETNATLPKEVLYDIVLIDPSDNHLPHLEGTITVEL